MISNLFYYDLKKYKEYKKNLLHKEIKKAVNINIQRGEDITSFICHVKTPMLIEEGFCGLFFETEKEDVYYELVTFCQGTSLFSPLFKKNYLHWKLVAITPLKLSIDTNNNIIQESLMHTTNDILQISVLNTLLFHTGNGINRVANYLWYDQHSRHITSQPLLPLTQERIQRKTLLSKSQITRIIYILKRQKLICTHYRTIQILDLEGMKQYINPLLYIIK